MSTNLKDFRQWLLANGFDPEDRTLTIGHPKVAQVDLMASFGSTDFKNIWTQLNDRLDVSEISVAGVTAYYDYNWNDDNYMAQQISALKGH